MRQFRHERRVTAMVGPIRIDDADFRNRWIPFFFIPEIRLNEFQIVKTHGKAHMLGQFMQGCIIHRIEAIDSRYVSRFFPCHIESRCRVERCFARIDRVNAIMFNSCYVCISQFSR